MSILRPLAAALASVLILCGPAAAQPRFELAVGYGSFNPSWKDAVYEHVYTPPFLYGTPATASGRQTLTLGADSLGGGSLSLGLVSGGFGVQVMYHAFSPAVSGTSSKHEASVSYTSYLPPDYQPRPVSLTYTTAMPDPSGELQEKAVSLDGFARLYLGHWFTVDLSAGATWFNLEGAVGTLDYWKFWLGGHSVLFSENYPMLMRIAAINRLGGNAGATLNWHIGTNAALWVEARYFLAGETEAELSFEPIDPDAAIMAFDPAVDVIPAGRLLVNPSFLRFAAGFRISL
jgi:hypothetical protein